jgi:hypothetical protein
VTLRRALGAVLALLGPAGVLAAAWSYLGATEPWTASEHVLAFDAALAAAPPDVVVLGSSYAIAATVPAALAEGAGRPDLRTVVLATPGAPGAAWYATLKGRVAAAGIRPRLVLVVANMGAMMQGPVDEAGEALVLEQLPGSDPALAAKAGIPAASDRWATVKRQRARLRDAGRDLARGLPVRLFFGDPELVDGAAATVFAAEARDGMDLAARVMPGVAVAGGAGGVDLSRGLEDADATLLPDMVALARELGANVVVALPPTHASRPAGQRLSPEGEARMLTWARAAGIGWVDLRDEAWPPSAFTDGRHMAHDGAVRFSTALGAALAELHAFEGPVEPPLPPATTERVASGVPLLAPGAAQQDGCIWRIPQPALPPISTADLFFSGAPAQSPLVVSSGEETLTWAAGRAAVLEGCTGRWTLSGKVLLASTRRADDPEPRLGLAEAPSLPVSNLPATWWVYPGGSLRWSWAEAPAAGALVVEAVAAPAGSGAGSLTLTAGSRRTRMERRGDVLVGSLTLPGGGPLDLGIEADADAPFAWVRSLDVRGAGEHLPVVRAPAARSVAIFATPPSYAAPPPAVAQEALPGTAGMGRFRVDTVDTVGCLRWEVTEDGVVLPSLTVPGPRPLRKSTRTVRSGDSVYYAASDGSDVAENGRRYALRYREDRRCGGRQWLLPGDRLEQSFEGRDLRGLVGPPRALHLAAEADGGVGAATSLSVELLRGEEVVVAETIGGDALADGVDLPIPAPATLADARARLTLRLARSESGPDLLVEGVLTDAAAPDAE